MSFRAELISDTHLNMWKYKPDKLMKIFSLQAPNLILAGDIGETDEDNRMDISSLSGDTPTSSSFYSSSPSPPSNSSSPSSPSLGTSTFKNRYTPKKV
jgi:hypothetical protein